MMSSATLIRVLVVGTALAAMTYFPKAFKPAEDDFGHTFISRAIMSSDGYPARGDVGAVDKFEATLSDGSLVQFAPEARDHVIKGVQSNDWVALGENVDGVRVFGNLFQGQYHCDNDGVIECSGNISILRALVKSKIQEALALGDANTAEVVTARVSLGKALHNLQDFYAHSNFTERNLGARGVYYSSLTEGGAVTQVNENAFPAFSTCEARDEFDGYLSLNPPIRNFTWEKNPGNWKLTSDALQSGVPYSTGWFFNTVTGPGRDASAPDGDNARCDHGFEGVTQGLAHISGINKDAPYSPFQPAPEQTQGGFAKGILHYRASYHAAVHTKAFLDQVVKEISLLPGYNDEQHDEMIRLLLGSKPVIAFVVDTTGSMQDIMDGVADRLHSLAASESATVPEVVTDALGNVVYTTNVLDPKQKYMLLTYGETANVLRYTLHRYSGGIGRNSYFGSASEVEAALRGAPQATGGGDCPEPTMAALLEAVRKVPRKSKLFVFTDASSKDEVSGGRKPSDVIQEMVRKKQLQVTFSASGSCSPIDPNYIKISNASGGQLLLVDHTAADTAVSTDSVAPGGRSYEPVHIESGLLSTAKVVSIPVETGAKVLQVSVVLSGGQIRLRDPLGNELVGSAFLGGQSYRVAAPAPGAWELSLAPPSGTAADYSVRAQVIGSVELTSVDYSASVEVGRPGHEVSMPFAELPATSVRVVAHALGLRNVGSYRFDAIGEDGAVLVTLNLSPHGPDAFAGTVDLGAVSNGGARPWRVRLSGVDAQGKPFSRIQPAQSVAKAQVLELQRLPGHWLLGANNKIRLKIKNFGPAQTYQVEASSTVGTLDQPVQTVNVPGAGEAIVEVSVSVLPGTIPSSTYRVAIVLKKTGELIEQLDIPVSVETDTDGDGVPDSLEKGPLGTNAAYDGNGDGVPDWQQAGVVSFPSFQRGSYLTAATSSGEFHLARTLDVEGVQSLRYGLDLLDFQVVNILQASKIQVAVYLPRYMSTSGFGRYGVEPGTLIAHWYDFPFDEASGLGAKVDKHVVTLHLKDGALGDDDLTANGSISVVGGPTSPFMAAAGNGGSTGSGGTTPPAASGGGGGCTIGDPAQRDASLTLLGLLAAIGVLWRTYSRRANRERRK